VDGQSDASPAKRARTVAHGDPGGVGAACESSDLASKKGLEQRHSFVTARLQSTGTDRFTPLSKEVLRTYVGYKMAPKSVWLALLLSERDLHKIPADFLTNSESDLSRCYMRYGKKYREIMETAYKSTPIILISSPTNSYEELLGGLVCALIQAWWEYYEPLYHSLLLFEQNQKNATHKAYNGVSCTLMTPNRPQAGRNPTHYRLHIQPGLQPIPESKPQKKPCHKHANVYKNIASIANVHFTKEAQSSWMASHPTWFVELL
jgi:hypothetical protein